MTKHRESSGGGAGDVESTKGDSPDAPAEVKAAKRFRVMFNPPSPVGDRAKLFECEAKDASDALAQWRAVTGFLGETAVQPVVQEIAE